MSLRSTPPIRPAPAGIGRRTAAALPKSMANRSRCVQRGPANDPAVRQAGVANGHCPAGKRGVDPVMTTPLPARSRGSRAPGGSPGALRGLSGGHTAIACLVFTPGDWEKTHRVTCSSWGVLPSCGRWQSGHKSLSHCATASYTIRHLPGTAIASG